MTLISWNVNGLRACISKGFMDFLNESEADIFCVQETKMQEDQIDFVLDNYEIYFYSAIKKGYSGTAVFTKNKAMRAQYGIGMQEHDQEGRVITLEYDKFFLVNVYSPNSKRELLRLDYRVRWENDFRNYLMELNKEKPVIICGDLNVAHKEIDLKNPKSNRRNAGFTDEERAEMTKLLASGFTDSFRYLYPDTVNAYTWWSYMRNAREKNAGWRIDYFLVSDTIADSIKEAKIYSDVFGSDHCPVSLTIEL